MMRCSAPQGISDRPERARIGEQLWQESLGQNGRHRWQLDEQVDVS
jgi:hypothetical protein